MRGLAPVAERYLGLQRRGRERARLHGWRRLLPLALAGFLLAALAVAALRIDLIRVRYGLADALREEKTLVEEQRQALAALRTLRDPARLGRLAAERGLGRPARIIDLTSDPRAGARP
jgi:hypothetical protein